MKRNLLYMLATLFSLPLAAQQQEEKEIIARNPLDNIIVRTAVKESLFPEERVYLHFDNSAYYLDEEMWFKAYVTSGENDTPTAISRVLYVELVAPEGYVVRTNKYKISDDGTCYGSFGLNRLLLSGYYEVRAYTRYMLNRGKDAVFSRVFPVFDRVHADGWDFKNMLDRRRGFLVDVESDSTLTGLAREKEWVNATLPDADVKFFPEGGHLVHGIESRVAFEVFAADGISSNSSITLLADGEELLTATPSHMGMGTFTLTPKAGTDYTAVLADGKKTRNLGLPHVEEEGVVLRVQEEGGSVTVNIKNRFTPGTEIGCAVLHRGKTLFYERYNSEEGEMTFGIDKNSLNEGVNRAVVFIGNGIPLAERMFFVTHDKVLPNDHESARLSVTGNGCSAGRLKAEPYEKIALSIAREDGKPIEKGSFSVSVSDAASRQETSYSYNIYTYMLLGSEVKGYIPNAARYFDSSNSNRAAELDLLMLTHGWTSYDWNWLSRRQGSLEQPIEKGIMVKGRYVKKKPIKRVGYLDRMTVTSCPATKVGFNIAYSDGMLTMYDFETDANGEFRVLTEDFTGKRVAKLVPHTEGYGNPRDSLFAFVLDRYFSPEMRLYHYWERNVGKAMTAEEKKRHHEEMIKINPFEYLLSNVEVISKRKKDLYYRPPRSEMRLDYLDEWEYAQDVTYLDRKATWNTREYGRSVAEPSWSSPSAFDENPPLSALDRWAMKGSGIQGGDAVEPDPTGVRNSSLFVSPMPDPVFNNTLSAFDILRSAFWRHNLNWCYWIQSIVVDGEYSSDTVPAIDEEYTRGVHPAKMTDFKEIVIRSDENTRSSHELWKLRRNRKEKQIGNFHYSSFYTSFTTKAGIDPRNGEVDDAPDAVQYHEYAASGLHEMEQTSIPNYVACFIPNSSEDARNSIVPRLAHYSTTRYTMVYGYTASKEFYAPDYSIMRPDSANGDYRRTLMWIPDIAANDEGIIEVELYNSTQARDIAVDVEGYAGGTFYSNSDALSTRESENGTLAGIRKQQIMHIPGIQEPELLAHCFRKTEEARSLFMQGEQQRAFALFSETAMLGYPEAIYNTAICYLRGQGVEKDSVAAFRNFRKAANMRHEKALHSLAGCYMKGVGTARNDSLALKYYTLSAESGNAVSQAMLGHMYLAGSIVEQDSAMALEWFGKACEKDEPASLYAMALIMEREDSIAGVGKRQLRKRPAIEYLARAASSGHAWAQYRLARCYEQGKYVRKSRKKAFGWYMSAASQGVADAMERTGYCYEKGRGVKKNEPQAAKWYRLAKEKGNEKARQKIEWYDMLHFFEE